jgi:predicted nucleotidyltransferase
VKSIHGFLQKIQGWATKNNDVLAVGYAGSWARGSAKPNSDLDLMIITSTPEKYLETPDWMAFFGDLREVKSEDWGLAQTRRAFYQDNSEIEFNITSKEWTKTDPVDAGTKQVVREGMIIVYDPRDLLRKLIDAVCTE